MSPRSIVRVLLAGLALLGLAQAPPGTRPASAAPQATPSAPPSSAPAPTGAPSPAPAASPHPGKDPLLEFVPREHVPADSSVSFPVDI